MPRQWMKQRLRHALRLLRGPAVALLLLAVVACNAEGTATPVPTSYPTAAPTPVPTAAPTATAEHTATPTPTPQPHDGYLPLDPFPWYETDAPTEFYGQPVYGGTLRIGYEDPLEHANVWGAFTGATLRYRAPTGATLVMENPYDPGAPVLPDLAEGWELHEGQDGVTFYFREDATWHNGEPFLCEDARFTFETMITGNGLTRSRMKGDLAHVILEEMTCLDDLTLEVKFDGPTAIPLHAFSNPGALVFNKAWFVQGDVNAMTRGDLEYAMFTDVNVGIGPFKWAEDQSVGIDEQRFERNHDYFIPELPYVDELVIHGIPDEDTQQAAMLAHQTDWHWVDNFVQYPVSRGQGQTSYYYIDNWEQYGPYVDHDQIVTVIRPSRHSFRLEFNSRKAPFDNMGVRQAIVMAIDRQEAVKRLSDGYGVFGGFGYSTGSPWELPRERLCSVPGWCEFDDMVSIRAEAWDILMQEGFDFNVSYALAVKDRNGPFSSVFIKEQLGQLGIKTRDPEPPWVPCPPCGEPDEDIIITDRRLRADDPNAGVARYLACDSYGKELNPELCTPDIVALLDQARIELDPAKRLALAHEIELATMKQYSSFPIYWELEAVAFWPEVRGYVHFPSPSGSFLKFMHMWIDPAHINDTGYAGQTAGVPGGM